MTILGFERAFLRAFAAAAVGVSVLPATAQEDEAAQPDGNVNPAAERVVQDDSLIEYQVRAGETEYMPGRFQVVDPERGEPRAVGTTGLLIVQNGRIVARAETDIGGVAQIRNLRPGPYSVIAIGPEGMGAFAIEVLPVAEGVAVPSYRFDALLVPAADMAVAQSLIAAPAGPTPPVAAPAAPAGQPLPPIPASLKRQEEPLITPAPLAAEDGAFEGGPAAGDDAAAPIKGDVVSVPQGERMVSHLVSLDPRTGAAVPMANSRVFFLRGGQLLGTIETNSEGHCAATGLESGIYSMVATGPRGFLAVGVMVETALGASTAGEPVETTYVSLLQDDVPTVDLRVAAASPDALPFAPGFFGPGPFGPGGFGGPGGFPGGGGGGFGGGGGGFGGGGGGLGGGGLLGALLGAGLGAGLGAALGDDGGDDEDFVPPPQTSPFATPGQGPPITPPGQGGTPPGQDDDD